MRTKTELLREAQRQTASARQRAMTLAARRRQAAAAAIPELEPLEDKVRSLGIRLVQLAAAGNGTVSLHRLGTATAQLQKLASGKYRFNGSSNAGRAWNVSVLYNGHQSAGGTVGSYQTQWFTDVPTTASYFQPVQWAAYTSTVKGYGGNLFGPLDGITREQFCTILLRYAQRFGLSMPAIVEAKTFSDAGQVSSWAKEAVDVCQQAGIIKGMGNNTFAPKDNAQRAQACVIILNAYNQGL